jgi:outer membrane immunogenic protein
VDFNALGLSDSRSVTTTYISAPATTFTINQSVKTDWLFTARPRIGWTVDNWLLYVTGGLAVTELKYANTFTDTFGPAFESGSVSQTKVGWVVGESVEYGLTRNWSVKAEYLYIDFGDVSSSGVISTETDTLSHSADLKANIVRGGINYRFN